MAVSSIGDIARKRVIGLVALVLLGAASVASVFFAVTSAHAQATGGDIFNVNPGGPPSAPPSSPPGAPPSSPPGGDQFDNQTRCQESGWFTSPDGLEKWRFLILPAQQAQQFESLVSTPDGSVRIRGCMDWCSATTRLCLVLQADPAKPIPKPRTTGTDCATVLAAARAAASSIEGGNTRPDAIINLTKVLQQCPPAYKRPIDCFDMMVDAQSKIRTNADYSKRRAQQALECYEGRPMQLPPQQFCSAQDVAKIAQAALDFDRGLMDDLTFGATRYLREQLYSDEQAEIVNEQAAGVGQGVALASAFIPIPGVQEAEGAKLAITFEEFARSGEVATETARIVLANAKLVWELPVKLRGEIIERVLAVLEYAPRGYDWVGILKGGTFRNIDFINYALKEQVSLKSMFRGSPESWRSGVSQMKAVIRDLGGMQKTWQTWTGRALSPACRGAADSWKRVLDLRVPKGYEHDVQELIEYGRQNGIEVRIGTF